MEQKHYDLIISLMEKHKKYSDYESIADKIAEDVYERSKVVLDTVADETAIVEYLTKVIATSIITVPKKLKFNTKNRVGQSAETIIAQALMNSTEKLCSPKDSVILKEEEIFKENSEEISFPPEEESSGRILEAPSYIEGDNEVPEEVSSYVEEDELFNEILEEEPSPVEEEVENETDVLEPVSDSNKEYFDKLEVNKTLVDNMINGLPVESELNTLDDVENDTEGLVEIYDNLASIEPEETEFVGTNNTDTLISEEDEQNETEETESVETNNLETLISEEDEAELEELDVNTENIVDSDLLQHVEEDLPVFDVNDLENNSSEDILELDENNELEQVNNPIEDISSAEQQGVISDAIKDESYSIPSYECFSYTPTAPNYLYTVDEYQNCIDELDKKYPEKQILTVCKLKYQQKHTIEDISAELNITKEEVLDTLNQIIYAIKE